MAKGYYKSVKRMSMKSTPRQDKFAKGLARVVNKFIDTKPRKKR